MEAITLMFVFRGKPINAISFIRENETSPTDEIIRNFIAGCKMAKIDNDTTVKYVSKFSYMLGEKGEFEDMYPRKDNKKIGVLTIKTEMFNNIDDAEDPDEPVLDLFVQDLDGKRQFLAAVRTADDAGNKAIADIYCKWCLDINATPERIKKHVNGTLKTKSGSMVVHNVRSVHKVD